jgi:flagellar assembly factor FliW
MLALAVDETAGSVEEIPAITFVEPVLGFPGDLRFALVTLDESGTLCELQSLDHEDLKFLVVPALQFYPDFTPEVSDEIVEALGLRSADEALVLLIVNAGDSLETTTVNLRGPLVVNTANRAGAQVVLEDADLDAHAPLLTR